jgi:hypothetical protein
MTSGIRSEQERGRVPAGTRAETASEALLGFLFYSSFIANLLEMREEAVYRRRLQQVVRANLLGPMVTGDRQSAG